MLDWALKLYWEDYDLSNYGICGRHLGDIILSVYENPA
jgi:hypothetical protein